MLRRALAVILVLVILAAPVASAHARLLRARPAEGSLGGAAPSELVLIFSEPVDTSHTRIQLENATGTRVPILNVTFDGHTTAHAALPALREDGYVVHWATISGIDGHAQSGTYAFAVGNASLPHIDPGAEATPRLSTTISKFAYLASLALIAGVLIDRLARAETQATARLRRAAAIALPLALLALAWSQAGEAAVTIREFAAGTEYGRTVALRFVLALVLAAMTIRRASTSRLIPNLATGVLAGILYLNAATSHAAGQGTPRLGLALDLLHQAAAAAWTGALAVTWTQLRGADALTAHDAATRLTRLSRIATIAAPTVALTGLVLFFRTVGLTPSAWSAALGASYGIVLTTKAIAGILMLAIGATNRAAFLRWNRRRGEGAPLDDLRANLRRETLVAAVVFLLAAMATNLSPAII